MKKWNDTKLNFIELKGRKLKQYFDENTDRFHTVEEAVALAERYESGHSGGSMSKFSISAFTQHLNHHNHNTTEQALSSETRLQFST